MRIHVSCARPLKALGAFVAAVCVCSAAGVHADACEPFELRIHLQVDRSITWRVVLTDLKHEIESLWSPYGVRVEWTDVRAGETATRGLSVEAILEPRIGKERNEPKWTPVLGRAFVNLTAPATRPIRVSFEATEELFALRTTSGASIATIVHDGELARALGRVLAHEIGHVLLGAPYHDEAGLMRRLFYPSELAAPDRAPFRLTCLGIGRLRGRIRAMAGYEPEAIDPGICVPGHIVR